MNGTIRKVTCRIVFASRTLGLGVPGLEVTLAYPFRHNFPDRFALASVCTARGSWNQHDLPKRSRLHHLFVRADRIAERHLFTYHWPQRSILESRLEAREHVRLVVF